MDENLANLKQKPKAKFLGLDFKPQYPSLKWLLYLATLYNFTEKTVYSPFFL